MTVIGLFDGTRHVGAVTLPAGRAMPDAVIRGAEVFLYFQGDQLEAGQRPDARRLALEPGEGARFLRAANVLRVDP